VIIKDLSSKSDEKSSSEHLTNRKKGANPDPTETDSKSNTDREKGIPAKDPLKWFGILVPSSLRDAQRSYNRAIELSLELANLQSLLEAKIIKKKNLELVIEKDLI
jgi:hypothetical protein